MGSLQQLIFRKGNLFKMSNPRVVTFRWSTSQLLYLLQIIITTTILPTAFLQMATIALQHRVSEPGGNWPNSLSFSEKEEK